MELTIIYKKTESGDYVGMVKAIPGAFSQGKTIEELKDNLNDAIRAIFQANIIDLYENNSKLLEEYNNEEKIIL